MVWAIQGCVTCDAASPGTGAGAFLATADRNRESPWVQVHIPDHLTPGLDTGGGAINIFWESWPGVSGGLSQRERERERGPSVSAEGHIQLSAIIGPLKYDLHPYFSWPWVSLYPSLRCKIILRYLTYLTSFGLPAAPLNPLGAQCVRVSSHHSQTDNRLQALFKQVVFIQCSVFTFNLHQCTHDSLKFSSLQQDSLKFPSRSH